mgnify:CR=1 FL=1
MKQLDELDELDELAEIIQLVNEILELNELEDDGECSLGEDCDKASSPENYQKVEKTSCVQVKI